MAPPPSADAKKNPLKAIISGGITGGIEICITYPTEYVKTHMQLYKEDAKKGLKFIISSTYQKYGMPGFYRGVTALIALSVPKTAVRFGTNEWLKNNVFTSKNRVNTFMAGLGAGIAEATFVVTPSETIKVKLIHDRISLQGKYNGLIHGIKTIVKEQGWAGCYKGLMPTIIKQGSNQGVRFLVFEEVKGKIQVIKTKINSESLTKYSIAYCNTYVRSSCRSSICVRLTFPLISANTPVDVIKTQMQGLEAHKYKSSIDCAGQILKNEGIKGFYKGTVPRLSRVVLDVAITFTLYEYITRAIVYFWPNEVEAKH